jgi:SAM-dependent methyltransferase
MTEKEASILDEQLAYYRARAGEYDEWFERVGRYDRGDEHRRLWFGEVATVKEALAALHPRGDVLELACGTGIWTRVLARTAAALTAVDASPEVLQINRSRLASPNVRYVEADLFAWSPAETYDFVFFGFWLSHVPEDRFDAFWAVVRQCLRPGGTAFFVDGLPAPEGTARDQHIQLGGVVERRLNDGRTYKIVKVFRDPPELEARLKNAGWQAQVRATPNFFLYGTAR